jgi:hypothetical protein
LCIDACIFVAAFFLDGDVASVDFYPLSMGVKVKEIFLGPPGLHPNGMNNCIPHNFVVSATPLLYVTVLFLSPRSDVPLACAAEALPIGVGISECDHSGLCSAFCQKYLFTPFSCLIFLEM